MNIDELDNFNLDDAIRFHNQLNPGLWDRQEHLRPEVREALLRIADDFREFLGVQDLQVKDITISGSNAAYTYTPHSDIDLHLVVDIPELYDPVYRELFNAKKYEYNDRHNIRVRDADVELYVQPSDDTHHSQGIYSIKDNQWLQVPRRRKATVDDLAVRHKYEDLVARIDQAIKDDNNESAAALMKKIRNMRQSGLDQHGEFGAENLAFKMLRSQGYLKKLSDAVAAAKDRELSLKERKKPKKKKRYGYGGYWYPGFSWGDSGGSSEGGDGGGGESVREDAGSTWDGVSPTTCMFTNEADSEDNRRDIIKKFAGLCAQHLKLKKIPRIILKKTPKWSEETGSFGQYQPDEHTLILSLPGRHILDVLRTMAHELTHAQQEERAGLPDGAGDTGSPWENEANARAGILMRHFAERHPEYFSNVSIAEASGYIPTRAQAKDPRFSMALTVDIQPGELGRQANKLGLQTDSQGRPALLMKSLAQQLREYKETPRKKSLVIFDIDDTLLHTTAKIRVMSRGRVVRELTNQQFNHYKLQPGEEFDFGEFRNAEKFNRESEPIKPMVRKLKTILINSPNSDVIMLTARADFDDKELFLKTFRDLGIDMSRVHVHRAGNLPGDAIPAEKKAVWVRKYLNTDSYDHVRLYDDSMTNLTVFKELHQEYPGVDFRAIYVGPKGDTKPIEEDEESYEIDDGNDPPGPESPPKFPAGTVKVDVSDVYDWYKLGQGISDIDDMNKTDFGKGPPSTVLAFGSEELENQYIKALKSLGLPVHDLDEPGEEDLDESAGVDLFEINMSPSNLRKMAAKTGAIAGMEFEMYVPNAAEEDDDYDNIEADYDMDESFPTGRGWQREVIEFFRGGDHGNSTNTIQRALDNLDEDYWTWKDENFEEWYDNNSVVFMDYLRAELPQDEDESDEEYEERLRTVAAETGGAEYESAMDQFREEYQGEDQWEEFLSDIDISTMQDFGNRESLDWPYMLYPESSGGNIDINDVASDFQSAIQRPVKTGGYHSGAGSQTNNYRIEPDGSLTDPDNPEDGGLEFISPPLPLDEMLSDLDKVVKWAGRNGCYTNSSTGLHMNVSVPGFELSKLDYVKLAIFLGDEYVLDQFGRAGNSYCQSAMENIRKIARTQPDKVMTMLQQMQGNLSAMASKIVHTGTTNKYTSINTKDGYIEFRSPGGDWLDEYANNEDKINNTLLRFTVALDVAMKPELYRQEYMKKLYKTLSLGENDDTIQFFARYAAGELPQSALKSFVKQAQIQRKAKKLLPGAIKGKSLIQWRATSGAATTTVVARTEEEARKKAAVNIGIPFTDRAIDTMDIQPLDLYTGPVNKYDIIRDDTGFELGSVEGVDERDAITTFRVQKPQWSNTDITARLVTSTQSDPTYPAATSNAPGPWTIMNQSTRNMLQSLNEPFIQAAQVAAEIAMGNNIRRADIRIINTENGQVYDIDGRPARYNTGAGGGFARAPHTSIYQVVNNRNGQIILGGETRTFAYTVEMANIGIRSYGIAPEDIRIIDLATDRAYNIDGSPANSSSAPIPGSTQDRAQQRFTVDYTIRQYGNVMNNRVTVPAANADAAMDNVRNQLEASRAEVLRIEAEPIEQAQARGTESLPPGNARWLILDRNGREVYSFVNTTAQSDANQYARQWLTANAQDGQGPYDVVPVT